MRTRSLLLILVASVAGPASAHELKLFANRLVLPKAGEKATVYLSWGHRFPVDDLVDAATLDRYDVTAPDGTVTALKKDGIGMQEHAVTLPAEGIHGVAVIRKPSVVTYVRDEQGNRQFRRGSKKDHAGARIDSSTRTVSSASLMLVAGASAVAPKPVHLPLELLPTTAPGQWSATTGVRIRVLVRDAARAGVKIVAHPKFSREDEAWIDAGTSDERGELLWKPPSSGVWVLKATTEQPAPDDRKAEFDTDTMTTTLTLPVVK